MFDPPKYYCLELFFLRYNAINEIIDICHNFHDADMELGKFFKIVLKL